MTVHFLEAVPRTSHAARAVPAATRARAKRLVSVELAACVSLLALSGCTTELDPGSQMGSALERDGANADALSTSCAAGTTLKGIDVSVFQGTVNWSAVKNDGVSFAFIRVSDGVNTNDEFFAQNWQGARTAGVRRGAYQFFRPSQDPLAQADLLVDAIGALSPGDLPPVLDLEVMSGQSAATVRARAQQWLARVEERLGITPIIYTGPYFWRDNVGAPAFGANHPLWIAHYTSQCPLVPEPWSTWKLHQFTDSGLIDGIEGPVDVNRFNGTESDLAALAFQGAAPDTCTESPRQVGGACASGCIWSSWAVTQGLQSATHTCQGHACACVVAGQAQTSCTVALCEDESPVDAPVLTVLSPAAGAVVANPVAFTFAGSGIRTVKVLADQFEILSFHPDDDGMTHSYTFQTVDVPRQIRVRGFSPAGLPVVEHTFTITPTNAAPSGAALVVLSPIDGAVVENPVAFSFAGQGFATVKVFAEQWQILSFTPSVDGMNHEVTFLTTGVPRAIRVVGYLANGAVAIERTLTITVAAPVAPGATPTSHLTTRVGRASTILTHHTWSNLTLWNQNFSQQDGADALANITATKNGGAAKRSCYGSAPCGTVLLQLGLLEAMQKLREVHGYNYFVTSIAGASHSAGSLHYAGRAFDIDEINGVLVKDASNALANGFMNACWNLGAVEVFGPSNDPVGHFDHIHCAF
jgi:GH25 family lysozyme M1 (1,4-beta-N-acetylmuramidase)